MTRLKGIRNNGNVLEGVQVEQGGVIAKFEHIDPAGDNLPNWLNLSVADDRLVAAALLLQSRHPGLHPRRDERHQPSDQALGRGLAPFVETPRQPRVGRSL